MWGAVGADGVSDAPAGIAPQAPRRRLRLCPSGIVVCPACGTLLRRFSLTGGSVYVTCDAKVGQPHRACGTHMHLWGVDATLCLVVELSEAEMQVALEDGASPRRLYERLGLLTKPLTLTLNGGPPA